MFELTGLGRIQGTCGANLLIPLFSARTSNHTYIHVLDGKHLIRGFQRCNTEYFDITPYLHEGIFEEGKAGLFAFDTGTGQLFVGTHSELKKWWEGAVHTIPNDSLVRAIIVEVLSDDPIAKYMSWREYASPNGTLSDELTELASSKLQFFQTLDEFWKEIDDGYRTQEETVEDQYRTIIAGSQREIIEWLRSPSSFSLIVWPWVWEHADRVFLETETSREIVVDYIEFITDEYPEYLDRNFAYIVRRVGSFDNLTEHERQIIRRLVLSNLAARAAARIRSNDFGQMVFRLYEGEEGVGVVDLIEMLSDITRVVRMGMSQSEIDYSIVRVILEMIASTGTDGVLTESQIETLLAFYIYVIYPRPSVRRKCDQTINIMFKPTGINTLIIREALAEVGFDVAKLIERLR